MITSKNKWVLVTGYRGSILHGTQTPEWEFSSDDIDIVSLYGDDLNNYLSGDYCNSGVDTESSDGKYDKVEYDLVHYLKLLYNMNMNVLAPMYSPADLISYLSPYFEIVREYAPAFLNLHIYNSCKGYAMGQVARMERENKYSGYMGERRKAIVDMYGYDTKYAEHAVRLLRMGVEILLDGTVILNRTGKDAEELKQIKMGRFPLDQIKKTIQISLDNLESAKNCSRLPEPSKEIRNALIGTIIRRIYKIHY